MARFLNLKGLSPSDFIDPEKFDKAKRLSSEYNFMARPDILPQDEPRFQEIIAGYLKEADDLASSYQKDKTIDIEQGISALRSKVQQELMSGEIPAMKARKMEYDSLDASLKKSKTPQEYAEARSKIKLDPIKYDKATGNYNRVELPDYFSTRDEKTLTDNVYKVAKNVKPDQFVEEFLQDPEFRNTTNYDIYTADKIKSVTANKVKKVLANYISQSSEYKRYIDENPSDKLFNDNGEINDASKFGQLVSSAAEMAAYDLKDRVIKYWTDYASQLALYDAKGDINKENKEDYFPTLIRNVFAQMGNPNSIVPAGKYPNWATGVLEDRPERIIWSTEQLRTLTNALATQPGVKRVIQADWEDVKDLNLPHEDFLLITFKDKGDIVKIDMRRDAQEIMTELVNSLLPIAKGTSQSATDINRN